MGNVLSTQRPGSPRAAIALALLLALLLTSCSGAPNATAQPDATAAIAATTTAAATQEVGAPPPPTPQPEPGAVRASPAANPLPPVRIAIPEIGLDAPVEPMGWRVVEREGIATTAWVVPDDVAGWHVNSAATGGTGNLIISGSQLSGAAVFAPLALGDVRPGQEVLVTDSGGSVYTYRIEQVSEPLPLSGGSAEEQAATEALLAPSLSPRLTLITGWPDFTSTHRIIAVAELVAAP